MWFIKLLWFDQRSTVLDMSNPRKVLIFIVGIVYLLKLYNEMIYPWEGPGVGVRWISELVSAIPKLTPLLSCVLRVSWALLRFPLTHASCAFRKMNDISCDQLFMTSFVLIFRLSADLLASELMVLAVLKVRTPFVVNISGMNVPPSMLSTHSL